MFHHVQMVPGSLQRACLTMGRTAVRVETTWVAPEKAPWLLSDDSVAVAMDSGACQQLRPANMATCFRHPSMWLS